MKQKYIYSERWAEKERHHVRIIN